MTTEPATMTPAEFFGLGYLQETNRLFLHPLGLGLQLNIETGELGVLDVREEADGAAYDGFNADNETRAAYVAQQQAMRHPVRFARLGYVRQPIDRPDDVDELIVDASLFKAMDTVCAAVLGIRRDLVDAGVLTPAMRDALAFIAEQK